VDALPWERSAEWAQAQDEAWEVDGETAGWVTEVGPLSFVRVADAGHMVSGVGVRVRVRV
jgi:carboxypeptidase C (cathepsin A)